MIDEIEFIEKYCCIENSDGTIQSIKLNNVQKKMLKRLSKLKDVKYFIFPRRRVSYIADKLVPLLQIQNIL